MSMNDRKTKTGKSQPHRQREESVPAAKSSNGGGAKATPNGKAPGRRAAFSTRKMHKQGTAARARKKSASQPTYLDAPPKIIRPFREQRSPEKKTTTLASPPVPSGQERGRSTASYTRRVAPEAGQVGKPQAKICSTRAASRDITGAAGLGRTGGSGGGGDGGGGNAIAKQFVTRAARRASVAGVGSGRRRSGSNSGGVGGGGVIAAVGSASASASTSAGASAGASAAASARTSATAATTVSSSSAAAASASTSAPSSAATTAVSTNRKWALSRLAEAPSGGKKRDKKENSTSGKGVASGTSAAAPVPKKKKWAPRYNSPRHYPILTAPKVRNSTSPPSTPLTVTTALGSSSESSSSMSDDGGDDEKGYGFGAEGGWAGGKVLGIGGPPPPPKTRTEVALEAWALTRRAGRPAKNSGDSGDPEYCYPSLMFRAGESARVTVRRVHGVRSGGGAGGGGGGGSSSGAMKSTDTAAAIEKGEPEELNYAMVEFRLANTGAIEGVSGLFVALGLEVADTPAETPAKTPGGTPSRQGLWTATFPVVSKVSAGGFAETWGVTPGLKIIEVGRTFMAGKLSVKGIEEALVKRKRKDKSNVNESNKIVHDNAKNVRAVASSPSRVVFSIPQPPAPQGNGAISLAGIKNDGGMACLGLKVHRGRNLTELCWSVNLSPDGGRLFDASRRGCFVDLTDEDHLEVADLLGFDVEWKQRPQGLQYIQVTSVTPGSLAARHGLQVDDMVLAVDGRHLISRSTLFFWQHLTDRVQTSGAHSPKSNWLRFLLVRKCAPQGVLTARKDETTVAKKKVSSADPTAFATGRELLVNKKDSERGVRGGGGAAGRRSPPLTPRNVCPSKRPCPSNGGDEPMNQPVSAPDFDDPRVRQRPCSSNSGDESMDPPVSTPDFDDPRVRQKYRLRDDRADACDRPKGWKPEVEGSHRCFLRLRPAAALIGAAPDKGGSAIPGAFLCEDINIGNLRIPSGKQLISVGGTATRDMSFKEATDLAMGGNIGTVLEFD